MLRSSLSDPDFSMETALKQQLKLFLSGFLWIFAAIFVSGSSPLFCGSAQAQAHNIQIRFTASNFLTYIDSNPGAGISTKDSHAGFDIVWNAFLEDNSPLITLNGPPMVLVGSGSVTITTPQGGGCTGNFSYDPNNMPFYQIVPYGNLLAPGFENNFDYVTFKFEDPSKSRSSGTDATLDDLGAPFACRTPQGVNFISGPDGAQSTDWTPTDLILATDSNPDQAAAIRSIYSVVHLNVRQLPKTVATTFVYTATAGTIMTTYKSFGTVEITLGDAVPVARDPYIQATPVPTPEPTAPPPTSPPPTVTPEATTTATPTVTPTPVTVVLTFDDLLDLVGRDLLKIMKKNASEAANNNPAHASGKISVLQFENGDVGTYNRSTNLATLTLNALSPGSGTLTPNFSVKRRGAKAALISTAAAVKIKANVLPKIKVKMPNSIVAASKSKSPSKVKLSLVFVPTHGHKIKRNFSFTLQKGQSE